MKNVFLWFFLASVAVPFAAHGQETRSPYTDLQARTIKALSPEDVEALLAGEGMGFALPAELNGYPGPRHVLDLADSLGLTPDQLPRVRAIFDRMADRAKDLGSEIVGLEAELDKAFVQQTVTADSLVTWTRQIAIRNGELRSTHLRAHLELMEVLSPDQVMAYQRLRGYGHGGHVHGGSGRE